MAFTSTRFNETRFKEFVTSFPAVYDFYNEVDDRDRNVKNKFVCVADDRFTKKFVKDFVKTAAEGFGFQVRFTPGRREDIFCVELV